MTNFSKELTAKGVNNTRFTRNLFLQSAPISRAFVGKEAAFNARSTRRNFAKPL